MKTIYLDLFSGISGDMFIGALLDLGLDFNQLQGELAKLKLDGYHTHISKSSRGQIAGTKFDVHLGHHHHDHGHTHDHHHHGEHAHSHGRTYAEIKKLISDSGFSPWAKEKSLAVFQRIATAEGKIHGMPPDEVHFHEVGAVDSIVDIAGACIGLEALGKPRILASEPVDGRGWIDCAHGRFPIPAPATMEILAARGITLSQCEEPNELITPTGAALLAEFVEEFGLMNNFTSARVGFGLGTRDNPNRPNVLRAILGESRVTSAHDWETDTIAVLETNLDDISPELLGGFMEKAMASGALDVSYTPMQMKKFRPGILLTILCSAQESDKFTELILRETTAFGVRRTEAQRRKLKRSFHDIQTSFGQVTVKVGMLDGKVLQASPEFESCKALAERNGVPVKQVYDAAMTAFNKSR